jgi:hypothetical protein
MTSSAAAYTSRIVAVLGESLGWHVKYWLANRISKVGRFRRAAAACIDAVGPAVARPGDGWRCDGRMGRSGTPLDSAGLVSGPWCADLGHSEFTDAGRTECGFHAAGNGEIAGQRPFRWAVVGGL